VFNLSIFGKKRKHMDSDKENVCGIFYLFFHRLRWLYNFFLIKPAGSHILKKHCIGIGGHAATIISPIQAKDISQSPLSPLPEYPQMAPEIITVASENGNMSQCFADTYQKGLNRKQAVWATKKYHGHRVLPINLMNDLKKANMKS
jgi:hypothetical protein